MSKWYKGNIHTHTNESDGDSDPKTVVNFFVENKEAVFFSNATECANKCKYYLNHPKELRKIAKMGNAKVIKILKPSNDNLLKKIINKAFM